MTPEQESQMLQQELDGLLAWATSRAELTTLDGVIGDLVIEKMGPMSGDQVQALHVQKTFIPFGVTPAFFVRVRASLLQIDKEKAKSLHAADLLDPQESLMIVWAMRDVVAWLESLAVNEQHYPQLLENYKDILERYSQVYATLKGHAPILEKIIDMAMDLPTARREIKRHEKGKSS